MSKAQGGAKGRRAASTLFSELLRQLMRDGVRRDGTPGILGRPWTIEEFADEIGVPHDTLRRWLSGARRPKHTINIERGFFGNNEKFESCRRQLRAAHEASQSRSGRASYGKRAKPYRAPRQPSAPYLATVPRGCQEPAVRRKVFYSFNLGPDWQYVLAAAHLHDQGHH
jgi:hypothetical protein